MKPVEDMNIEELVEELKRSRPFDHIRWRDGELPTYGELEDCLRQMCADGRARAN